jgi:hypothetical protein
MVDPTPLYPIAQPGGGSILATNPLQLVGALNGVNALKAFQAKQAVGNALLGARNPDGSIDTGKFISTLPPQAALAAPEAAQSALDLRQRQIGVDTSQFNLGVGYNDQAQKILSGLAGKDAISDADLWDASARLARTGMPAPLVNAWRQTMLNQGPDQRKQYATTLGITAAGPAAVTERQNLVGPDGQPISVPTNIAARSGALPTGLPPGQGEALAANQGAFVKDQAGAATTLQGLRPLQNALPLLQKMTNTDFGPGSEGFAQVKSALITAGIIGPNTTDTEVRQEANKYLRAYAGQTRTADRSDRALEQALGSNPNLDLTQGANLALVKNQIAMDRMDAALPVAFEKQFPSPADKTKYLGYKSNYYQNTDPRAFQFDLMTPQERRAVVDSLGKPDSPAYQKFARSYALAKQAGIFTPANGQ